MDVPEIKIFGDSNFSNQTCPLSYITLMQYLNKTNFDVILGVRKY